MFVGIFITSELSRGLCKWIDFSFTFQLGVVNPVCLNLDINPVEQRPGDAPYVL